MARQRVYQRGRWNYGYANGKAGFYRGKGKGKFSKYGDFGITLYPEYLAGMAVGALTDLDNNIPAQIKVAAACAPVKGTIPGKIKGFMQGMLLGDVIQAYTGFSAVKTNTGTASAMWSNTQ